MLLSVRWAEDGGAKLTSALPCTCSQPASGQLLGDPGWPPFLTRCCLGPEHSCSGSCTRWPRVQSGQESVSLHRHRQAPHPHLPASPFQAGSKGWRSKLGTGRMYGQFCSLPHTKRPQAKEILKSAVWPEGKDLRWKVHDSRRVKTAGTHGIERNIDSLQTRPALQELVGKESRTKMHEVQK